MKLVQTEQEVAKYELLEQAMGLRGLGWEGDDFSAEELDVCRAWLRSKSYTIAGGSSEVQLNIIAKRGLELPYPPEALRAFPLCRLAKGGRRPRRKAALARRPRVGARGRGARRCLPIEK